MDFYQRLRNRSESKYQAYVDALSRIGDPDEIFAHIAAMPICCEEGSGLLHTDSEVRIDERFVVICHRKDIAIYLTQQIQSFHVCGCETYQTQNTYRFCINDRKVFYVTPQSAYALYTRLAALRPDCFQGLPYSAPVRIFEGTDLLINGQEAVIRSVSLFGKEKKTVIPLRGIRECYQLYDSDSESFFGYLILRGEDESEYKICTQNCEVAFLMARILKSQIPELVYIFPQPLKQ